MLGTELRLKPCWSVQIPPRVADSHLILCLGQLTADVTRCTTVAQVHFQQVVAAQFVESIRHRRLLQLRVGRHDVIHLRSSRPLTCLLVKLYSARTK